MLVVGSCAKLRFRKDGYFTAMSKGPSARPSSLKQIYATPVPLNRKNLKEQVSKTIFKTKGRDFHGRWAVEGDHKAAKDLC